MDRLVILDGVPRDGLALRIKRFISTRFVPRTKEANAVNRYLAEFRTRGVRFYSKCAFKSIDAPVFLVTTGEDSDLLHGKWSSHASVTRTHLPVEHIELVKYPIPVEVIRGILDGFGADHIAHD